MINLEFEINGTEFILNEKKNIEKLKSSKFKELGFFSRKMLKANKWETIYFAKNCFISMFKSIEKQAKIFDVDLLEELRFGPSGDAHYYSGPWGTSAYMYYVNDSLKRISFQTISNRIMSVKFIEEFEKRIVSIYGKPELDYPNKIKSATWRDLDSVVISELNEEAQNSYIHWLKN